MKPQPTVVNGKWVMTWIENDTIAIRKMNLLERIRYYPRMFLQKMVTGYKFPKI